MGRWCHSGGNSDGYDEISFKELGNGVSISIDSFEGAVSPNYGCREDVTQQMLHIVNSLGKNRLRAEDWPSRMECMMKAVMKYWFLPTVDRALYQATGCGYDTGMGRSIKRCPKCRSLWKNRDRKIFEHQRKTYVG